ncbi:rhomboid family intramembrane serine protease [Mesorhizobium sp. RP14(2022)]|uniref:Rhomboid family intramembrane serine protease n=1 Tax=Mesorhizobium liriopis TaxID=2953882 RepID=A0ABT1CA29_9HYPH|nr:rhomboid family intramembrane serine protease [Mesorhizobium liriopis]MCO6051690.1 rhomboid family intramembrane serine protease [Mesorhizobium liriopis]
MFIPIHDANHLRRIRLQWVTIALIAVNVGVHLFSTFEGELWTEGAVLGLGFIPALVWDQAVLPAGYAIVPEDLTFLTYSFLHADWLHLGGNMLFLWVFGDNVEDALGHFRYVLFYCACAAAGALCHGLLDPGSQAPLIGASGAIAGIISAYLILHPRVKIWVLAFGRIPLRLPAWIVLAAWIVFQFAMLFMAGEAAISFAAHVGGLIAGAVLVVLLRRRDQPILDSHVMTPRAAEVPVRVPSPQLGPWGLRAPEREAGKAGPY